MERTITKMLLVAIMATTMVGAYLVIDRMTADYALSYAQATIHSGERVWTIAENHFDQQDKYRTMNQFMDAIYEVNGWDKLPSIRPGDTIKIPLYTKVVK